MAGPMVTDPVARTSPGWWGEGAGKEPWNQQAAPAEQYLDRPVGDSFGGGVTPQPAELPPVAQTPVAQAAAPAFQMPSMNDYLPMIGQAAQGAAGKDVLEKQIEAKTKLAAAQVQSKNTGMMTMFSLMAANNAATHQANVSRQYGFEKIAASRYGHFAGRETQGANDGAQQATMQAVKMGMSFGQSQAEEKAAQAEHDAWTDPATSEALVKAQTGKYLMEIAPHVMARQEAMAQTQYIQGQETSRQNANLSMQEKLRGDALTETAHKNDITEQHWQAEEARQNRALDIAAGKGTPSTPTPPPVKAKSDVDRARGKSEVDVMEALANNNILDPKTGKSVAVSTVATTPQAKAHWTQKVADAQARLPQMRSRQAREDGMAEVERIYGPTHESDFQEQTGVSFAAVDTFGGVEEAQAAKAALVAAKSKKAEANAAELRQGSERIARKAAARKQMTADGFVINKENAVSMTENY